MWHWKNMSSYTLKNLMMYILTMFESQKAARIRNRHLKNLAHMYKQVIMEKEYEIIDHDTYGQYYWNHPTDHDTSSTIKWIGTLPITKLHFTCSDFLLIAGVSRAKKYYRTIFEQLQLVEGLLFCDELHTNNNAFHWLFNK